MTADEAFAIYAAMVKRHKREPDLWDHPDRVSARDEAHRQFRVLFEAVA